MEEEPIWDVKKILAIRKILRAGRYVPRDEAMFVVGIKPTLRIGYLLALMVGDVQSGNGVVSESVEIKEKRPENSYSSFVLRMMQIQGSS